MSDKKVRNWTKWDYVNDIRISFEESKTFDSNSFYAKKEKDTLEKGLYKLNKHELAVLWHQIINK